MTADILEEAEDDLEHAFAYYQAIRSELGADFVEEFRRAVERILEFPNAWQPLDLVYRRCRFHRFPYGIIYRADPLADRILIVAIAHLSRAPGWWRGRTL